MSIESVQYALKERFAAPLPEFYQRRIIFWQDEEREFEGMVDELDLPGVEVIKLTGSNNFEVKKLLLHDDLTSNFLIYNPFSYRQVPSVQGNLSQQHSGFRWADHGGQSVLQHGNQNRRAGGSVGLCGL